MVPLHQEQDRRTRLASRVICWGHDHGAFGSLDLQLLCALIVCHTIGYNTSLEVILIPTVNYAVSVN